VKALGDIGLFRIVSEGSIGSNIRRVDALTGMATVELLRDTVATANAAAGELNVPTDELLHGVQRLQTEQKELRSELARLKQQLAVGQAPTLAGLAIDGVVVARVEGVERDGLRDLAVSVRDQPDVHAVVLGAGFDAGGVGLVAAVTPESALNAGALIEDAKKTVGGGGKPSADLAVAGGKHLEKLDDALDQARAAAGLG